MSITAGILAMLAKNELIDRPKNEQNSKFAAIQKMYEPLTGQKATREFQGDPSTARAMLQGGMAGWQQEQNNERASFDRKMQKALFDHLLSGGNNNQAGSNNPVDNNLNRFKYLNQNRNEMV